MNKAKIRAVIFDMDGVLVDSEVDFIKRLRRVLQKQRIVPPEQMLVEMVGAGEKLLNDILQRYLPQITWSKLVKAFLADCVTFPLDYPGLLFADVKPFLAYLRSNGYRVGLASASELPTVRKVLEDCELVTFFDTIYSGTDVVNSKPHPEIYLKAAAAMQVEPAECLIVEDSEYGIRAAVAAGAGVVAARRDCHFNLDQSAADIIFDDMRELEAVLAKDKQGD